MSQMGRQPPIEESPADAALACPDAQAMSKGLSCSRGPVLQAPAFVTPMAAQPVTVSPTGDEWLYESKRDGSPYSPTVISYAAAETQAAERPFAAPVPAVSAALTLFLLP